MHVPADMARIRNAHVLFNSVPEGACAGIALQSTDMKAGYHLGYPVPGETTVYDTTQTIDLETAPLDGGFLIKTLVLSVDPYFRLSSRLTSLLSESALPWMDMVWGVVLRSENPTVKVGKHVSGITICAETPCTRNTPSSQLGDLHILEKHPDLPWSAYVGAAGMPGQTAFAGWQEYADAKPGEVAFVTTGAGGVGSIVIQLAKQAGLKVIASAGSEEKVEYMKSLNADVEFNYKTTDTRAVLAKEGPIDVFWDNVGGDIVDAAIEFAAPEARFLECGAISGLSNTGQQGIKAPFELDPDHRQAPHIHGIMVRPLLPKYIADFYATIPAKLASGELKYAEEVTKGLDKVGDVILAVQKGTNKAKAV
ncbi:hypothetical protein DFH06DRAFT_1317581 [Mycena polygramma]|nr:hypothetical protein DFH06DRAFT_1317581 [Mycena polygramma]